MIFAIWNKLGWQLKVIVSLILLIVFLIISGLIYHSCTQNALEGELQREKEARSTEHQDQIDESKTEVNKSANLANEAKANTQRIENANFSNTKLSEAEKLRCKAFPNSKGCL